MLWSNLSGKANPARYGGIYREATLEQSAVGSPGSSVPATLWSNLLGTVNPACYGGIYREAMETVNPACYGGIYREAMFYGVIYREQ